MKRRQLLVTMAGLLAASACAAPDMQAAAPVEASYTMADYARVPKFDAHVHANVAASGLIERAAADNFQLLSINVDYSDFPAVPEQLRLARLHHERDPLRFHFAGTVTMEGWGTPAWRPQAIAQVDAAAAGGAVAIKVWKNIGMSLRDADGDLVLIDDPRFDPLAEHLEAKGLPLIAHQGEPRNCWLPLEQMTTDNDREYFRTHPQYHMYLHPEMPSYETLMAARDRFVARHPGLKVDGAHMASLEWSVDELARFLDAHPNAVVDLAARMSQVQYQSAADREKVRVFFIRYADRLLYATDLTENPGADPEAASAEAHRVWQSDWRYLATGESQNIAAIKRDVAGLALPKPVIDRIYWANARAFFGL